MGTIPHAASDWLWAVMAIPLPVFVRGTQLPTNNTLTSQTCAVDTLFPPPPPPPQSNRVFHYLLTME